MWMNVDLKGWIHADLNEWMSERLKTKRMNESVYGIRI